MGFRLFFEQFGELWSFGTYAVATLMAVGQPVPRKCFARKPPAAGHGRDGWNLIWRRRPFEIRNSRGPRRRKRFVQTGAQFQNDGSDVFPVSELFARYVFRRVTASRKLGRIRFEFTLFVVIGTHPFAFFHTVGSTSDFRFQSNSFYLSVSQRRDSN